MKKKIWKIALLLFCVGQMYFTYKGIENVPFFHYGMFSYSMSRDTVYYYVKIDGKEIDLDKSIALNTNVLLYNIKNYERYKEGDTQVRSIIHHRVDSVLYYDINKMMQKRICNSKDDDIYKSWFARYLKREYAHAHYIEIGKKHIEKETIIRQSIILEMQI